MLRKLFKHCKNAASRTVRETVKPKQEPGQAFHEFDDANFSREIYKS